MMNLLLALSFNQKIGSGHLFRIRNIYLESKVLNKSIAVQCNSNDRMFLLNVLEGLNFFLFSDFNSSIFKDFLVKRKFTTILTDLLIEDMGKIAVLKEVLNYKLITILSYEKEIKQAKNSDCLLFPSPKKLKNKPKIRFFSGPDVLFLNREIINMNYSLRKEVKNILIFFGGTDPANIMDKVYKCVKNENLAIYNFTIVSNKYYPSLKNIKIIKPGPEYFQVLYNSDLAIINGGTSRYEMAYIGIPTIAISIHEEQYQISQITSEINNMVNLGVHQVLSNEQIVDCILRKSIDLNWRSMFYKKSIKHFGRSKNAYYLLDKILTDEKNETNS